MKAYGKRVLVLPDPVEEKTAGGIVLPKSAQEAMEIHRGTVVNTGESVDVFLDAGDRILMFANAGVNVEINGIPHLLVNPDNILAIL